MFEPAKSDVDNSEFPIDPMCDTDEIHIIVNVIWYVFQLSNCLQLTMDRNTAQQYFQPDILELWTFGCLNEEVSVVMCDVFLGRCSKTLRAAWTWMASFLLCTARTAAKSPLTTSSSCWLTSGSESLPHFCYLSKCLVTVAQTHFHAFF